MGPTALSVIAAAGAQAVSFVILGSIVIPLAILAAVCWSSGSTGTTTDSISRRAT